MEPSDVANTLDHCTQAFKIQMTTEGITREKFRRTDDLAKEVGMDEEFKIVNPICSKFVHPTAWSLFTAADGPQRFPQASEIFYATGTKYLATVFATVAPHVRKYGLCHAK